MSADLQKEQVREYVRLWAANGPLLEELRDQEIREADTSRSIRMFDLAFKMALRDLPPRTTSGLVEWQNAMHRWRRDG